MYLPIEAPAQLSRIREETPRSEYPRPQFTRPDWLNLNGVWDFAFDDSGVGLQDGWSNGAFPPNPRRILVPFSFETVRSGIHDRSFHSCVWYRRQIRIPAEWQAKRILLHFGAVDYLATVWVNGVLVASHEGGHTPFSGDISGALEDGRGEIVVRAEDPPTDRYIPRGKQHWEENPASIFYARTTGIWQTVWAEPVPFSYLESVRITPSVQGGLRVEARICDPGHAQLLAVRVSWQGDAVAEASSLSDGPRATVETEVPAPKLWSPASPSLYDLRLELRGPEGVVDVVESYCGFRSFSTRGAEILLNGEPIYLKTVLDQGYWPESNLTPPDDEAIRFDIETTLSLGFNGVRKHQKVEDPRFLYWADRLGLLVSSEMANAYLFDSDAVARMTREWIEVIQRDYNHPSIVIWVPVNESWGVPNISDLRQQAHLRALYYLSKSLDETRLVIDNDGWEHTEVTDLFAIHDYTQSGEEFLQRYAPAGVPLPLHGKLFLAPGNVYNGSPVFLSEFGGVAWILPDEESLVPENSWGYSGLEPTALAALNRIGSLYDAISKIGKIRGICYTQLYDVEQEVNGLMTYDRRLKFDPAIVRGFNSLLK